MKTQTTTIHEAQESAPGKDLIGLSEAELEAELIAFGVPERQAKMRQRQLWQWLYCHGETDFEGMSNLAKDLRARLASHFIVARPEVITQQVSVDGTRKWLLRLPTLSTAARQPEVEMVYIPEADRGTLCISSQVGCTLNCRFCHTGTQKLVRNLSRAEIVGQVLLARDLLGDWPGGVRDKAAILPKADRLISNVVFMGMGEPLYNYDEVVAAVRLLTHQGGIGLSKRRVTVSTAGIAPLIPQLGADTDAALAISLHAVTDKLRNEIVPINKKYPLAELLEACRAYPNLSNVRRITFEYVMLKDVNDSDVDAYALVRLLRGIPAKINLIPFNPWPGSAYHCSDWRRIEAFADLINRAGYASPIRRPRGRDIFAACGQLKSNSEKVSARARKLTETEASV